MKKVTIVLGILVVLGISLPTQAQPWQGSGTESDPYLIYNADDMQAIGANPVYWDKHFKLMADIDLSGTTYATALIAPDLDNTNIGFQGTAFTGTFDGNEHTIANLTIDTEGVDNDYLGLFGCLESGGEITNLGIEDMSITDVSDSDSLGGLVGLSSGNISNCYATGSISGSYYSYALGGLVAINAGGSISNCYATSRVAGGYESDDLGGLVGHNGGSISNSYATGSVSGGFELGGLVGLNWSSITNCYATGTVTGNIAVGGLVGYNSNATISNCYATGVVTRYYSEVGGLVGGNYYEADIFASFWDIQTAGQDLGVGYNEGSGTVEVFGKTTIEMKQQATFTEHGWDFENVWDITEGEIYPYIRSTPPPPDLVIIYVPDDYSTIQAAIDAASNGDTIIVHGGTYTGEGNRDIDFKGKAITLSSENGSENCIIDCQGTETNQHRGFYFHSGEDENSVVDGFSIINGCIETWSEIGRLGGGIYCDNGSSPTISNCLISHNSADEGGGICCDNGSNPTISNCLISHNSADDAGGGIACWSNMQLKVSNCQIIGNTANGFGGGIAYEPRSDHAPGAMVVRNCLIVGNSVNSGGGAIVCNDCTLTLENCSIVGNLAKDIGGGVYCSESPFGSTISNCAIWNNRASNGDQIVLSHTNSVSVSYSDVQGGQETLYVEESILDWGLGNIDTDQLFVDPGYWDNNDTLEDSSDDFWVEGDYHLLAGSPCIDAGDPDSDYTGQTDIDDEPRVINGRVDIGADEYSGSVTNQPPNPPTNLVQLRANDLTEIEVGGTTDDPTVVFAAEVNDPDGDQVKLQIELRRLDEYEGEFLGQFTQESDLVSSGSEISIPVYGLIDADYHWQARTVDEYDACSPWVQFGGNDISETDFTVNVSLPSNMMLFDRDVYFALHEFNFGRPSDSQRIGLDTLLNFIENDAALPLDLYFKHLRWAAYMLATTRHETDRVYEPIPENWDLNYHELRNDCPGHTATSQEDYFNYWYSGVNGNGDYSSNDGFFYRGRGYVQITGRYNYTSMGTALGIDLVNNPDLALIPNNAYKIMSYGMLNGTFTGVGLDDFITDITTDYFSAREIVNGTDHAQDIANAATKFEAILRSSLITTPANIEIQKLTIKAGKSRTSQQDSLTASCASFNVSEAELDNADSIYVDIYNAGEADPIFSDMIPFDPAKMKKGKYNGKNSTTSIKFDINLKTLQLSAKNIALTRLSSPVVVEVAIGDYSGSGTAYDGEVLASGGQTDVINGKQLMPMQLLSGYEDSLRVDKCTFNLGTKASTDSLTIQGAIAVEDTSVDIAGENIVVSWGDYDITLPANDLYRIGSKKAFKYEKSKETNSPIASAIFDLEKCTFKIVIKNANISSHSNPIDFSIQFADFSKTVTLQLTENKPDLWCFP